VIALRRYFLQIEGKYPCQISLICGKIKTMYLRKGGYRLSLFVIADLHLSFGVQKPMDIFPGWEDHVERLTENWNRLIGPEDTVVIPGDISWGLTMEEAIPDFAFLDHLPGKKILLKGNHDLWFSTKSKVERCFAEQGFTTLSILFNNAYAYQDIPLCGTRGWMNEPIEKKVLLRECGRLRMSLEAGKKIGRDPLVFLHYPPIYGGDECYDILEVLAEYEIKHVYYGHLHSRAINYAINGQRWGIDFQLVSCDFLQFCPKKII
jgi:predicted phosphohydrolase